MSSQSPPNQPIVSLVAILGRSQLMPGIQQVRTTTPPGLCLVKDILRDRIELSLAPGVLGTPGVAWKSGEPGPAEGEPWLDISDCTLFLVQHEGRPLAALDLKSSAHADDQLEQALEAISELTLWCKSRDQIGSLSSFLRQLGRVDVKFFLIDHPEAYVLWANPLFETHRAPAARFADLLGGILVTNGPSSAPLPALVRRVLGALDLINLGFYSESFVSLFAIVDDLVQDVVSAGLAKKGFDAKQQEVFLRSIKEQRMYHYVNNLIKVCDWESLSVAFPDLNKRFVGPNESVNTLRNRVMHASTRLSRAQVIDASNVLLEVIAWLRGNPFGYAVSGLPLLKLAETTYRLIPREKVPPPADETNAPEKTTVGDETRPSAVEMDATAGERRGED